jgi:membrane-associated phospholipid phosphatase
MKGLVWRIAVVATPVVGAGLIAGTRIMDARHHPFDVVFGSLLGVLIAWIAYRQYFPPLSDFKGKAYPVRTLGSTLGDTSPRVSSDYTKAPLHDEESDVQTV